MLQIDKILELVVEKGASDLHLTVGSPPVVRLQGRLRALNTPPLTPEDTMSLMKSITSDRCQQELAETGGSDFGFSFGDKARFRVSVLKGKGNVGMVLRQISNTLLSLEQIGLPASVKTLLTRPRGMFLVTGPTGSGKSTTLASCVDFINSELDSHIITIEDPIEFVHKNKACLVNQREIGSDTHGFKESLRAVLRQDPDVVLVGEMRDMETIEAALTLAETGHLTFGTLHTSDCVQTINRIVDVFPAYQQQQIRTVLSFVLQAVFCQQLLPRADGRGRALAAEIMIANSAVKALIRDDKAHQIYSIIQTGGKYGMQTMNQALFNLVQKRTISYDDAFERTTDPEDFIRTFQSAGLNTPGQKGARRPSR
ncbi:MAG TPA: type IV pili twitching motility protein PilT [Planctomycetes bacterium]|nr:type IV pili twitching motility protein PilT [Planctomycetota bacterium]